ncbi:MAG TPA: hypothetical protein VG433_01745, partial [Pirellulales bacterium]|nr:hypothetical protein [Pirellulales bacterium]
MIKRSTVLFAVLSAAGVPYLASTRLGETTPAAAETQPAALDAGQAGPGEAADYAGARPGALMPVEI